MAADYGQEASSIFSRPVEAEVRLSQTAARGAAAKKAARWSLNGHVLITTGANQKIPDETGEGWLKVKVGSERTN